MNQHPTDADQSESTVDIAAQSDETAQESAVATDADPEVSTDQDEESSSADEETGEQAATDDAATSADTQDDDDDDEDEEDDDDGPRISLFAEGDWYVIHTYAGYENKVRANLGSRIQSMNMEDKIFEVVIPTEEVMDFKSGKKQVVQKKVFPGYILVRMELDDDSWYVVRNTPGVTGFVGAGAKPTPLDLEEVGQILDQKPAERAGPRLEFEVGEVVQVTSGAFNSMSGPIEEINVEQQKVRVLVNLFGRETPVELPFDQVAKL